LGDDGNTLGQALLLSEPTIHAQSCRFARFGSLHKGLHAVLSHENSSVADVEEYTEARDVVNDANDGYQILEDSGHPLISEVLQASEMRIVERRPQGAQAIF
jgi:hypothetical protein